MTKFVTPEVFHLATTSMADGRDEFLERIGAAGWTTDARDDHSELVEVAGRACYRSFGVGLNKNVTRVREGNDNYLLNSILRARHGSVLEHATDTFGIVGCSRILTHELVRHRAGTAFSQESGRYVRVDEVEAYWPEAFSEEFLSRVYDDLAETDRLPASREAWIDRVQTAFRTGMGFVGSIVQGLEAELRLDAVRDFGLKKKLQSAARRLAPAGQSTTIVVTANHRAWRHLVSMRTSSAAEEEIRLVQYSVFEKLRELHPAIYQDAELVYEDGILPSTVPVVRFECEGV